MSEQTDINNKIIEFPNIKSTKVSLEINDSNYILISVPTQALKWVGKKISSIFGRK